MVRILLFCALLLPFPLLPPLPTSTLGNGQYLKVTLIQNAAVRNYL